MENTQTLQIPVKEAKELYREYKEAVKMRKEGYLRDLKQVYYHLSRGAKMLDIYEVFKKAGVNENGEPKLAIAPASAKMVYLWKEALGAGRFSDRNNPKWDDRRVAVNLPTGTFPNWKRIRARSYTGRLQWQTARQTIQTRVPIVPAHLLPEGRLDNDYYLLWEVTEWSEVPTPVAPSDPFLLKRINSNAFVVLAEWDLTPIEQAVIRGL